MNKKLMMGVALCSMVAGLAQAADIRYSGSGDWSVDANWDGGVKVTTNDTARMNWGNNTVTVTTTEEVGRVQIGVNEPGNLVITGTGHLTTVKSTVFGGAGDMSVGNNGLDVGEIGTLTVNAGGLLDVENILYTGNSADGLTTIAGTVNVSSHLWTGWNAGVTGTYEVNDGGELNVGGMLGLNWEGGRGTGLMNINDGGIVNLSGIHAAGSSIMGSSLITLDGTGVLTKTGNFEAVLGTYIGDGFIVGSGGETLDVTYDVGQDLTIVTIPEPATLGLLAVFGGGMLFFRRRFKR